MAFTVDGSNGLTFPDSTTMASATQLGLRNRIINGAMLIDQRNAGASVTPTGNQYVLDRWSAYITQTSKFSVQQNAGSVTPPTGFSNYLGVTSLSAYSVAAGDLFTIGQPIEGFNTYDLAFGTSGAKTVTLSFWVRSSLTGTFGGAVTNSAQNRAYPFSYTISSANTWEQKSISILGDTTGTWIGATNGIGLYVHFGLGVGSTYSGTSGAWAAANYWSSTGATSVVGTNGATFYITGVQLERGSAASPFDWRPYGTEFALCQRYFQNWKNPSGRGVAGGIDNVARANFSFLVEMRTNPTLSLSGSLQWYDGSVGGTITSISGAYPSTKAAEIDATLLGSTTSAGRAIVIYIGTTNGTISFNSEL